MKKFFVFGYNKSGTTFLQKLLDAHPKVNCPPEHHLNSVISVIRSFCPQYKAVIESFDQNTGRQGIRFDENFVLHHAFRGFVEAFMFCEAHKEATHVGLNDNSMGLHLEFIDAIFPSAKFIAIVRDPREIAVSLFHHKMRTERVFPAKNGTLSVVARAVGPAWANHMQKLRNFEQTPSGREKLYITYYRDLIGGDRQTELHRIFAHLDVPVDEKLVGQILAQNSFAQATKKHQRNGFLRSGRTDSWVNELVPEDVAAIESAAADSMLHFGYEFHQE
ncbi:sulfotransferase family protein [Rhodopirellula baltica]|uniref:Tyrosylprotein sulfotransferase 2 n=1 Tax=Rhodopirellula baltica WH47 TaxID=991778 RepID=F2AS87_RHOBT|nr:sulfotransferase [Rhodopirellula baltica]EGF27473.1 tyrosylprotein sulfotransferase 2 [Rhodopirellula baltica WH47]